MPNDTESPAFWASVQDAIFQVLQVIDLRLALVIGLAAFMLAVGFDSSGNAAEAADLVTRSSRVPVTVPVTLVPSDDAYESVALASDGQLATAYRLRHGTLTSAILTSNRLTEAHLFTDLPAGQ